MRHELQMVAFQPSQRHTNHLEKPHGYMGKPTSVSSWCFLQNGWDVHILKTKGGTQAEKVTTLFPPKKAFDEWDCTLSLYFKIFCNMTRLMSAGLRFRSSGRHSPSHLVLLPLRKKPLRVKIQMLFPRAKRLCLLWNKPELVMCSYDRQNQGQRLDHSEFVC